MKKKVKKQNDLLQYRMGKLTILQLMGLLAILGIAAFFVIRWLIS